MKTKQEKYLSFVESVDELLNDFLGSEDMLENDEDLSTEDEFIVSLQHAIDTYFDTSDEKEEEN